MNRLELVVPVTLLAVVVGSLLVAAVPQTASVEMQVPCQPGTAHPVQGCFSPSDVTVYPYSGLVVLTFVALPCLALSLIRLVVKFKDRRGTPFLS
jgi:hypothetical protein